MKALIDQAISGAYTFIAITLGAAESSRRALQTLAEGIVKSRIDTLYLFDGQSGTWGFTKWPEAELQNRSSGRVCTSARSVAQPVGPEPVVLVVRQYGNRCGARYGR